MLYSIIYCRYGVEKSECLTPKVVKTDKRVKMSAYIKYLNLNMICAM